MISKILIYIHRRNYRKPPICFCLVIKESLSFLPNQLIHSSPAMEEAGKIIISASNSKISERFHPAMETFFFAFFCCLLNSKKEKKRFPSIFVVPKHNALCWSLTSDKIKGRLVLLERGAIVGKKQRQGH